MAHPRELVARIKGALKAGLKPKQISYHTGIPEDTIDRWARSLDRCDVEPDETIARDIRDVLLGKFNGSLETR